MPTYEYKCEKCGQEFEEFQSIKAEPLTKCRNKDCGGTVKRLFSTGAGFLFKGSGFYITDNRSDSYKKKAKDESGASVKTSGNSKDAGSKSSAGETKK